MGYAVNKVSIHFFVHNGIIKKENLDNFLSFIIYIQCFFIQMIHAYETFICACQTTTMMTLKSSLFSIVENLFHQKAHIFENRLLHIIPGLYTLIMRSERIFAGNLIEEGWIWRLSRL